MSLFKISLALFVTILLLPLSFADGPKEQGAKFFKSIGIIQGKNGDLMLDKAINRAELLKIITIIATENAELNTTKHVFNDVDTGTWYAPYANWGYQNAVINGVRRSNNQENDTTNTLEFQGDRNVTTAETLKIVTNAFHIPLLKTTESGEWFQTYYDTLLEKNLIDSRVYNQLPYVISRGDAFELIYRAMVLKESAKMSYEPLDGVVFPAQYAKNLDNSPTPQIGEVQKNFKALIESEIANESTLSKMKDIIEKKVEHQYSEEEREEDPTIYGIDDYEARIVYRDQNNILHKQQVHFKNPHKQTFYFPKGTMTMIAYDLYWNGVLIAALASEHTFTANNRSNNALNSTFKLRTLTDADMKAFNENKKALSEKFSQLSYTSNTRHEKIQKSFHITGKNQEQQKTDSILIDFTVTLDDWFHETRSTTDGFTLSFVTGANVNIDTEHLKYKGDLNVRVYLMIDHYTNLLEVRFDEFTEKNTESSYQVQQQGIDLKSLLQPYMGKWYTFSIPSKKITHTQDTNYDNDDEKDNSLAFMLDAFLETFSITTTKDTNQDIFNIQISSDEIKKALKGIQKEIHGISYNKYDQTIFNETTDSLPFELFSHLQFVVKVENTTNRLSSFDATLPHWLIHIENSEHHLPYSRNKETPNIRSFVNN